MVSGGSLLMARSVRAAGARGQGVCGTRQVRDVVLSAAARPAFFRGGNSPTEIWLCRADQYPPSRFMSARADDQIANGPECAKTAASEQSGHPATRSQIEESPNARMAARSAQRSIWDSTGPQCYTVIRCETDHRITDDPVLSRFRAALAESYGNRLERAVLFGSRARGDFRPDSDYDVAVFIRDPGKWFDEVVLRAELGTDILIDTGAVISAKPFRAGTYNEHLPLMDAIRQEGIDL